MDISSLRNAYELINPRLQPYKHQVKAMNEAFYDIKHNKFHALFMEMGTGKTKTTIDTFMALVADFHVNAMIVIAPKSICSVWADGEIPRHLTISANILMWTGSSSKRSKRELEEAITDKKPLIYIVNTEAFQTLPDEMRSRVRDVLQSRTTLLVVDESSYIKSPDAKRSKHIKMASQVAAGVMCLSGTEITNSPLDLFMQFEVMKPGFWNMKNFFIFRSHFAILQEAYAPGGKTFKKVVGFQRMNELMDRIEPYCSRALKRDCLDLPNKIYMRIDTELSTVQQKVYDELKNNLMAMVNDSMLTVPNKIALFTKFRQIPGGFINVEDEHKTIDVIPPKLTALLDDLADTDEQAIITAAFTPEILMLVKALSNIAPTVAFYGGNVDTRDHERDLFVSGKARFIVINPGAGAYGLNLQEHCNLMYSYSRVLSPDKNWQMEDRIHRLGQHNPCVYKILVARGTVDERIEELLAAKTDIRTRFQDMTIEDMISLV